MRSYVVYQPPNLETRPGGYPLMIGLHGTSSDAYGIIGTAGLVQKANQEQFIVACPNALVQNLYTYFNAGGGYEELTGGLDDLGFISAVIDTMIQNYPVDTTKIYVLGHSNGGIMAYRMAAQLSHQIAAIASNAGPMTYEYCDPEFPVPIIHVHGLSDPLIPFEGGTTIIYYPPTDSILGVWREINGCSSIPDTIYNEPGIIGRKWISNKNCDVVLYTIRDMPHKWSRAGETSYGLPTTDVMWDFLKLHQRDNATNIENDNNHSLPASFQLCQNYPNPFNSKTVVSYQLSVVGFAEINIYNSAGQFVRCLFAGYQSSGYHEVIWDGRDQKGELVSSGVYLYCLKTDDVVLAQKMMMMQ